MGGLEKELWTYLYSRIWLVLGATPGYELFPETRKA